MGIVKDTIAVERGLRAEFVKAFNNGEMGASLEALIMRVTSNKANEKYGWLGEVPQMREWIDDRKISGLKDFDYTIKNKSYEVTIGVDRDELEDDQIGAVQIRIRDLAKRATTHPIKLMYGLISDGATNLCFDGQPFFSASHTFEGGSAQSNIVSGSGASFANVQTDFRTARAKLRAFVDDQKEPINQGDLVLAVACSPALESIMREVFVSDNIVAGNSNVERGQVKEANIHVSGRLTGNDWYLFEIGDVAKPFVIQTRRAAEFRSLQAESESGFMRKHFAYGVDYRVGAGYGLWQKAIKIDN